MKTAWSTVTLDFSEAVITHDTLEVDVKMQGGTLTLVTAPGIVIDPNQLRVKHGLSQLTPGDPGVEPRLVVRLAGRLKHGLVQTQTAGD